MKPPIVAPDSPFPDDDATELEVPKEIRVRDGEISVRYTGTFGITWRENLYFLSQYRPALGCFLGAALFWGMLWLMNVSLIQSRFGNSLGGAMIIFLLVLVSQSILHIIAISFNFAREFPIWNKSRVSTFSITPTGYVEKMPGKTSTGKWRRIKCVRINNGDVYFIKGAWTGGNTAPREAFMNLEDAQRFYEIAYRLWKTNGGSWYEVIDQYQSGTLNKDTSQ